MAWDSLFSLCDCREFVETLGVIVGSCPLKIFESDGDLVSVVRTGLGLNFASSNLLLMKEHLESGCEKYADRESPSENRLPAH